MSRWGQLVLGQVVKRGAVRPDTVRVRCLRMELDKYLNKYFNKRTHFWAIEEDIKTDIGDVILIERLSQKLTPLVTHKIKENVFKIGAVVDPVTGQKCRGKIFIDEEMRLLEELQINEEFAKRMTEQSGSATS